MNRRDLLILGASAAIASPLAARAQQKAMPVIGFFHFASPGAFAPDVVGLRRGLSETGYVEGQNVAIEYRWAEGHPDRLPAIAADFVGRKVDVIVAAGGLPVARAAKSATSTIPIVFDTPDDPVASGLVASLARPGGNLTGVGTLAHELTLKRFELLSELVPQASAIALLVNPNNPNSDAMVREVRPVARTKGVQLPILTAGTEGEIEAAFAALADLHASALIVEPDPFFTSRREQLVALASRNVIPVIYAIRELVGSGGLISYGPNLASVYRLMGIYAGRILKGERASDLPVQQPDKFELVINLKTAQELGLTLPQSLLARADEVIE